MEQIDKEDRFTHYTSMDTQSVGYLLTGDYPTTQKGRWDMVSGLMDHLVGTSEKPGIATRTLANPSGGSFALNEGMERISHLMKGIQNHPSMAAIPDPARAKANLLMESEAYNTLVALHVATRPRAGVEHGPSVLMALDGPHANKEFWNKVPQQLPTQWEQTKKQISTPAPLRPQAPIPHLGRTPASYGAPAFPPKLAVHR